MRILFIPLTLMFFFLASCKHEKQEHTDLNNTKLSISILPQKYFVERIAGNDFELNVMIPPGASPATYEPTPKQMKELSGSGAYLQIGYIEFEKAWMERFEANNPKMKIYDLSENIPLITTEKAVRHHDHYHKGIDPHIWVSPKQALRLAENCLNALADLNPEKEAAYRKSYDSLKKDILQLDKLAQEKLSKLEHTSFMIFHPALTYLARDYGLKQIPIELEGKSPSPEHMQRLINEARTKHIRHIFIQEQFNIENAKAIAKEIDAEVVQINPLDENWFDQMKFIILTLEKNLNQTHAQ